jgi:hypothetical protein
MAGSQLSLMSGLGLQLPTFERTSLFDVKGQWAHAGRSHRKGGINSRRCIGRDGLEARPGLELWRYRTRGSACIRMRNAAMGRYF